MVGYGIWAWRQLRKREVSGKVEKAARELIDVVNDDHPWAGVDPGVRQGIVDEDDPYPNECMENLCATVEVVEGDRRGADGARVRLKTIRRGCRNAFVKYWVQWTKVQFPSAWRSATAADRVCIANALTREMRARSVRDKDIASVKDVIVILALTPSAAETFAAQLEASWAIEAAQMASRGWVNKRGGTGLQLGSQR